MNTEAIILRKLRVIENVEHAVFALERGMPAPPSVVDSLKSVHQMLVADYNESVAAANQEPDAPDKKPGEDESEGNS
jgi:hypothetical protein